MKAYGCPLLRAAGMLCHAKVRESLCCFGCGRTRTVSDSHPALRLGWPTL